MKILKIYLLVIWFMFTIGNVLQILGNKDYSEKIDILVILLFISLPTLFYIFKS